MTSKTNQPSRPQHAPAPVFSVSTPALGTRLIHSPAVGVVHVTSCLEADAYLTGLVDKQYPDASEAQTVDQPGVIFSDASCELHLLANGELAFVSGDKRAAVPCPWNQYPP